MEVSQREGRAPGLHVKGLGLQGFVRLRVRSATRPFNDQRSKDDDAACADEASAAGTNARSIPAAGTDARPIPAAGTDARPVPAAGTDARPIPAAGTNARPVPPTGTDPRPISTALADYRLAPGLHDLRDGHAIRFELDPVLDQHEHFSSVKLPQSQQLKKASIF